jgi:glycosyltransferase involved in cell wall biosynthesis
MNGPQWIVSQIGSRERYAVPRAFEARGHLKHFYTDIWLKRGRNLLKRLPRGDGLAHRYHSALPPERVTGFNVFGIDAATRGIWRRAARTRDEVYSEYIRIGEGFARRVTDRLSQTNIDPSETAAFLFTTGAMESCEYLRKLGVPIVADQLDPARVDEEMIAQEIERWPGWEEFPGKIPEAYYSRLAREWELSDIVLVNSNWSRLALLKEGVDAAKIIVVPLCYEQGSLPAVQRQSGSDSKPLTVLWLGQIVLRKGIPYLFDAAKKLAASNVRFIVAGRIGISEKGLSSAPENVTVLGKITHGEAAKHFAEADVFVLPTVSDGFALTQLEAMSFGLPVITTPNCGDVVTNGMDGFIIPPRDSDALADAIMRVNKDRALLRQMQAKALETVKDPRFSLEGYADAVESALAKFRQERAAVSGARP